MRTVSSPVWAVPLPDLGGDKASTAAGESGSDSSGCPLLPWPSQTADSVTEVSAGSPNTLPGPMDLAWAIHGSGAGEVKAQGEL